MAISRIGTDGIDQTSSQQIGGISVGKGAGAVSTNTAVGASALAANTTGASNAAVGYQSLQANTTASYNTATGYQALYSNTGAGNTAFGAGAGYSNTTGNVTALGFYALNGNTTGANNTGVGDSALRSNTTGASNVAMGVDSLRSNTTGNENTAVGYQAGYSQATGFGNVYLGRLAGYPSTGDSNTFLGALSGYAMTSGSKNTILGRYNGNQGGLDIRTASNKVVLSDGDGNPVIVYGGFPQSATVYGLSGGYCTIGLGGTGSTGTGALFLNGETSSGWGPVLLGYTNGSPRWQTGSNSWIKGGTAYDTYTVMAGGTGGVNLTNGATSWTSASDERLKDIIEPISDGLNKVASLRAVIGKYKDDETAKRRPFLIAQDVQVVLPEAISESRNSKDDETEYLQLSYTEVIPLLVAAIKELKAEFDAYKEAHP